MKVGPYAMLTIDGIDESGKNKAVGRLVISRHNHLQEALKDALVEIKDAYINLKDNLEKARMISVEDEEVVAWIKENEPSWGSFVKNDPAINKEAIKGWVQRIQADVREVGMDVGLDV